MRSILLLSLNLVERASIKLLFLSDWISFCFKACLAFFSASFEIDISFLVLAFFIVICLFSFIENVFSRSFVSLVSVFVMIKIGIVLF